MYRWKLAGAAQLSGQREGWELQSGERVSETIDGASLHGKLSLSSSFRWKSPPSSSIHSILRTISDPEDAICIRQKGSRKERWRKLWRDPRRRTDGCVIRLLEVHKRTHTLTLTNLNVFLLLAA